MRYTLPWFPLSDDPSRCSCRTIRGCRPYRSSLSGYRFGRSGSSGFAVCFHHLRWSSCIPAPRVRSCRDRCRDRYTCRQGGLPARGGCRPKRSGFGFRVVPLKSCWNDVSETSSFFKQPLPILLPRRRSCTPKFLSYRLFEDFGFNQLVVQVVEIVLYFAVGQFAVDQVAEVVVVIAAAVVGFQAVVGGR